MTLKYSHIRTLILFFLYILKLNNASNIKSFNVSYVPAEVNSFSNFKMSFQSTFKDIKNGFLLQIENSSFEFKTSFFYRIDAYFDDNIYGKCNTEITNKQIEFNCTFDKISESKLEFLLLKLKI